MHATIRRARRWLYWAHRWIGIATCVLCVLWLFSGIVMMYVPFPELSDGERLAALGPIDWAQVRITPAEAVKAASLDGRGDAPMTLLLEMLDGAPVYRLVDGQGRHATIDARSGQPLRAVAPAKALSIARAFPGAASPQLMATVGYDQWTVPQRYNPYRPMYRIALGDAAGTQVYVASTTGEVVDRVTGQQRFWNGLGAIPHWIYFTPIRHDPPLWDQIILWTSGIAFAGAAAGTWVGILRLRLRHRYRASHGSPHISPYAGWMLWHHIAGLLGCLSLLAWLFSGWLSMNPNGWFDRSPLSQAALQRYAHAGPVEAFIIPRGGGLAVQARFTWVNGQPLTLLTTAAGGRSVIDGRTGQALRLTQEGLFQAARRLMPGAHLILEMRLEHEDAYWYSHTRPRPLPVLRAVFDDRTGAWFHIDPVTGEVLGGVNRSGRTYRWLFNALHDLDLRLLLLHRPAWDIVVIALSCLGLVISVSGTVIGWRRLRRATGLR